MGGKNSVAEAPVAAVSGNYGCIAESMKMSSGATFTAEAPMTGGSSTIKDASGNVLLATKSKMGFNSCQVEVMDGASGNTVCIAYGKKGMTSGSFHVFVFEAVHPGQAPMPDAKNDIGSDKDLYLAAEGKISLGFGKGSCEFFIVQADGSKKSAYKADKPRGMKFEMPVWESDKCDQKKDSLVAKVLQPGMSPNKMEGEFGAGMDLVALCVISAYVGVATGSGGAAIGGLAGAGVI